MTDITIVSGQGISNSDLAFLRSYSVYDGFIKTLKRLGMSKENFTSIQFIASEYPQKGQKYRFGRITITLDKMRGAV
jgi:hypothetical protein